MKAAASPIAAEVSWKQVHAFRLARHHLIPTKKRRNLITVARDIGGAQAQVMSAAELQLAVRTGGKASHVREALWRDRSLVKTWLMRGTLHLIPANDLPLYTAAMQGRWMKTRNAWLNYLQMTEAELNSLVEDIGEAMDGTPVTREEILSRVGSGRSDRVREILVSGWGGMLKAVARKGLLCFGPSRGQSVTFVGPRQWLGAWRDADPDAAIAEVARRYLRAYGPATRFDFARWWGNWPGVGQAAWSGLQGEIAAVSVDGERGEMLTADLPALIDARVDHSAVMLPPFDPYVMGHTSRDHLLDSAHVAKVSRTAGWISAVVLVDGRVEGTWTHKMAGKAMGVTVAPFQKLPSWVASGLGDGAQKVAAAAGVSGVEVKISASRRA